jgi:hypothetical protein
MQQFCEVCRRSEIRRFAFYSSVAGLVCFQHRMPEPLATNRERARALLASPVPQKRGELRRRLASVH